MCEVVLRAAVDWTYHRWLPNIAFMLLDEVYFHVKTLLAED
jgi:hypothetical protein